ncbi:ubiquitin-conjugating enzyme E2 U isoform X2 [Sus scrofa]|uniref:ubiquitin-conjugating enzyme E2 U isoform X2 n=1 Tax=Sus scrofa TaxID=9823 RepID=UPI000A2B10BC|nr:ubiquitin-conjugating enzyme E2 U isoform X2 [Sus scrofa]
MLLDPSDQLTRFGKVTQNLRHLPQSELWECEDQCQILCCLIMYSRAYILLQRDFQELKRNNYKGINAFPISEDLLEWEVDIKGLQNTIWQGSFFQLTISFTSEYNFVPPVVRFRTIPFHPNDPYTGRPCIDFLDNPRKWNRNYTLSSILLTLQVMLSNPVLENPVNLEAAQILMKDETLYRLIILRLSRQALKLNNDSSESHKEPDKLIRYATALARIARENKRPHKSNYPTERSYLCTTPIPTSPDSQTETDTVTGADKTKERWKRKVLPDDVSVNEPWEEEVEDLVAWTNTLDTDALED